MLLGPIRSVPFFRVRNGITICVLTGDGVESTHFELVVLGIAVSVFKVLATDTLFCEAEVSNVGFTVGQLLAIEFLIKFGEKLISRLLAFCLILSLSIGEQLGSVVVDNRRR